jgi:hypothetical protein
VVLVFCSRCSVICSIFVVWRYNCLIQFAIKLFNQINPILSHFWHSCLMLVARHEVWIDNWIYWMLLTHNYNNYNTFTSLPTLQITTAHTNGFAGAYVLLGYLPGSYVQLKFF